MNGLFSGIAIYGCSLLIACVVALIGYQLRKMPERKGHF